MSILIKTNNIFLDVGRMPCKVVFIWLQKVSNLQRLKVSSSASVLYSLVSRSAGLARFFTRMVFGGFFTGHNCIFVAISIFLDLSR